MGKEPKEKAEEVRGVRAVFVPKRVRLTWEEIGAIERKYKGTDSWPDIRKLITHMKLIEHLLHQATKPPCPKCSGTGSIHKGCILR